MSQENVEIIRTYIAEWNRGAIDTCVQLAAPDGKIYPFPEWPGEPVYEGRDGWRALINEWTENFEEVRWDTERVLEVDDHVVALIVHRARIKDTDVPLSLPLSVVCSDFREGTVGKAQFFMTWAEGLEAVGLSK